MSQPVRLLVGAPNSELARLVQAARHERPAAKLPGRILAGLAGGAATSVASAASATAAVSAGGATSLTKTSSLLLALGKWVGMGVLGGGLLAASAGVAFAPRAPSLPVAMRLPAPAARHGGAAAKNALPELAATSDTAAAPVSVAPPSSAAPTSRRQEPDAAQDSAPPQTPQLAREAALVEAARSALAAGNSSLALQKLAEYRSQPVTGALDREARVLRIDALVRRGELEQARALSEAYLSEYPRDAHQARLRGLLQTTPRGSIHEAGDTKGSGE